MNHIIDAPMARAGTLANDGNYHHIPDTDVIEKCVHRTNKQSEKTFFFRFPNLEECS